MYPAIKFVLLEVVNCLINLVLLVTGCYCGHVFGEFIHGTEITTIDTIGPNKCGQHCLSITGCLAYNYDREMLRCHLLADNSSTGTVTESKKMRYENRENIPLPSNTPGFCISDDCPKIFSCMKLSSGQQTCLRRGCDDPSSRIVDKESSRQSFPVGLTIKYQCTINSISVTNEITCKANGQWTNVNQLCECPEDPYRPFEMTPPTCKHIGCVTPFICRGYRIVEGDNRIICGNSGTWSNISSYSCVDPGCGPLFDTGPRADMSGLRCTSTECTMPYFCNTNYRLFYYRKESTCLLSSANRTWSDPALMCHYECARLKPVVANSTLLDPNCVTTCTYICDDGYHLVGESVRNCSVGNGWDSGQTSCQQN